MFYSSLSLAKRVRSHTGFRDFSFISGRDSGTGCVVVTHGSRHASRRRRSACGGSHERYP